MSEHNAATINRVGRKIRAIRETRKLKEDEFVAFRNEIYTKGADENREAFVDQKLKTVGLDPESFD